MEISTRMEFITADILAAEFVWDLSEPRTGDVNGEILIWLVDCISCMYIVPYFVIFVVHSQFYELTSKAYISDTVVIGIFSSIYLSIYTAAVIDLSADHIYWIIVDV